MEELIRIATADLTRFLDTHLPDLSEDWWPKHVVDRLSFPAAANGARARHTTSWPSSILRALLRVLDQNWYELSSKLAFPAKGVTG